MEVKEAYKNYEPPVDVTSSVKILLSYVPDKYLNGLDGIILYSSNSVNRSKRRENFSSSKVTLGSYYLGNKNRKPHIELFVDIILHRYSGLVKIPMIRNFCIGKILYHEIGHHIQQRIKPEYKDKEKTADDWSKYLIRKMMIKRYFYMMPLSYLILYIQKLRIFILKLSKRG